MSADFLRGRASRSRQTMNDVEFLNMKSPAGLDTAAKLLAKGAVSLATSGLDSVPGMVVEYVAEMAIDAALDIRE